MFTPADVLEKLSEISDGRKVFAENSDYLNCQAVPQGIAAMFVRLNGEWGWKGYYREREHIEYDRDYNYTIASLAAKHGVGPDVGDKLDIILEGRAVRGFLQRIAEPVGHYLYGEQPTVEQLREKRILLKRLSELGFGTNDLHSANIGYLDGKMVALDLSHSDSDIENIKAA